MLEVLIAERVAAFIAVTCLLILTSGGGPSHGH